MILFAGDIHGCWDHLVPALQSTKAEALVLLGDVTSAEDPRPVEDQCRAIEDATGAVVRLIRGNHETDDPTSWKSFLTAEHRDLTGRIEEIAGLRVAGLGGVFRAKIWMPDPGNPGGTAPVFKSYKDFERDLHQRQGLKRRLEKIDRIRMEAIPDRIAGLMDTTRNGELRRQQTAIFWDTHERLWNQRADVLVTHEAPGCGLHPNGFDALAELAQAMKVKASFHGHQHDRLDEHYRTLDERLGFKAYGVGFCGLSAIDQDFNVIAVQPGDFDDERMQRMRHPKL